MTEYASVDDLKTRATAAGWKFLADRDHDGVVSTTELLAVNAAIQWAGRKIDKALAPQIEPTDARAQQNGSLNDLCVDLAFFRFFRQGGDDAPQSVVDDYEAAMEELRAIKGGEVVPGLTIVPPYNSTTAGRRVPRAYMPRRRG